MPVIPGECLRDESLYSGRCDAYRGVSSADELGALLDGDLPVTVQGARTGIAGAAVPEGGCVCDMGAFAGIEALGESGGRFFIDALAGTTLGDLIAATEKGGRFAGYFFAPDPTERGATLGGLCATNAGGPSSLLYGRMADHVAEAALRLADGRSLTLKRGDCVFGGDGSVALPWGEGFRLPFPESPPRIAGMDIGEGSDLLDVFMGSEGMLGIFERLRLGLIKRPAASWGLAFFFGDGEMSGAFADAVADRARGWEGGALSALEYLDRSSLTLYSGHRSQSSALRAAPEPPQGLCAVMAGLIADSDARAYELLEEMLKIAGEFGCGDEDSWAVNDAVGKERLRLLRHGVPEAVNARVSLNRRGLGAVVKLAADITLPSLSRAEALSEIHRLLDSGGIAHAVFGHVGGKGLHINLLPEDEAQLERAGGLYGALMEMALSSGGLIAAENGVGKLKRGLLKRYLAKDRLEGMASLKQRFDPRGRLNPGNMT
ncbi:MAG: FAD-binding oxidoreductase [Clostridiales Family XIII bacterium]|jgi:FAD/FMN-containing dehydrogenase|nr:FAD-binding oxidoreductase [Clostridiales Family XIII bacterium]